MKNDVLQKMVKKACAIGVLMLLAFGQVFAQNYSIKGKLTDEETGQPVSGVNVLLQGTNKGTVTDSTGAFIISGLENKLYDVAFSNVGYSAIHQTILAGSEVTLIELSPETTQVQGVEVYGKKRKSAIDDATVQPLAWESSITRISNISIQNIGATNVASALKYNVGANVTEQGRKRKEFYSIRGQMTNADFAIDGVSMYYFLEGPSAVSSAAIQEIEVTRSSNALLYGFSGLNGVVNIKTKKFNKFETFAEAEYGTFKTLHASITHGGKIGGFHYLISATRDQTDGPFGRNAAEKAWNFFGKISYSNKKWLDAELQQLNVFSMREFAQTVSSQQYPVSVSQMSQIWKYDPLNLSLTLGKVKIKENSWASTEIRYYYIQNKKDWYNRTYIITKVKGVQTLTSKTKETITSEPDFIHGAGIVQTILPVKNNTLRIAGDYFNGAMWTNGAQKKSTVSGVILDEHSFGKFGVNLGVKVLRDFYKDYAPSTARIKNKWQPAYANFSVGASYIINENTILNYVANAGKIPVAASSMDTSKNPIKSETRTSMDLGIVKRIKDVGDITFTLFFANRKNATSFYSPAQLYNNSDGTQAEYIYNIDLRSYGAELAYQSPTFLDLISGFANLMGQYTADVTNGQNVKYERVPGFITSGGFNIQKFGFNLNILGRYTNKYIGDRFIVIQTGQKVYVGDYFSGDVNLSYKIPHTPIFAYIKAANILDKHYCTISPAYPDYGRRISFGVKANF